jgi:hypothetical protein
VTLPLRHRSDYRLVEPFAAAHPIEEETPLFAADAAFARAHGGPVTRAFVDALPADWRASAIVDTSLVWLTPGIYHGDDIGAGGRGAIRQPPRFRHEPFPCVSTGVRGEANRNLEARHRLCVLGLDCAPEAAVGEVAFSDAAAAEAFWLPADDLEARDRAVEAWLAEGTLAREALPTGAIVEHGWGALLRPRRATASGFQLVLRATAFDRRPAANLRRNLFML